MYRLINANKVRDACSGNNRAKFHLVDALGEHGASSLGEIQLARFPVHMIGRVVWIADTLLFYESMGLLAKFLWVYIIELINSFSSISHGR